MGNKQVSQHNHNLPMPTHATHSNRQPSHAPPIQLQSAAALSHSLPSNSPQVLTTMHLKYTHRCISSSACCQQTSSLCTKQLLQLHKTAPSPSPSVFGALLKQKTLPWYPAAKALDTMRKVSKIAEPIMHSLTMLPFNSRSWLLMP